MLNDSSKVTKLVTCTARTRTWLLPQGGEFSMPGMSSDDWVTFIWGCCGENLHQLGSEGEAKGLLRVLQLWVVWA